MSAVKEGCKKAFQNQSQRLVAPMYSCRITVNSDVLGKFSFIVNFYSFGFSIFPISILISFPYHFAIRPKKRGMII